MTSRQRMLIAMKGGQPDSVPVAPGMTNMIPGRLTGKPFWDIHLHQDPPRCILATPTPAWKPMKGPKRSWGNAG